MTLAQLLSYLADVGVIANRPNQRELRDVLALLGLYPETELHEITQPIIDPRGLEDS